MTQSFQCLFAIMTVGIAIGTAHGQPPRAAAPKEAAPRDTRAATPNAEDETEAVTRVALDDVEYVYQGTARNGNIVKVTVLATSKKGDRDGPNGIMTLIDDEGDKYTGPPS